MAPQSLFIALLSWLSSLTTAVAVQFVEAPEVPQEPGFPMDVGYASTAPYATGRRLSLSKTDLHPRSAVSPPSSLPPPSQLSVDSGRTAQLMAQRMELLEKVAQIDKALAEDRNRKRKELTERFERDLASLEVSAPRAAAKWFCLQA